MPTVLRKYGFRFHFYSADGTEPPHIHVDADGKRAKIWLSELEIAKNGGFNPQQMRRILSIIEEHRNEILEAWNEYFG
ncbi:DUF4160 domain-containing protein [Rhizobium sp. L1K21]|uniref:DUF4160 domain-containing protein n=1 Tax=Rhizobium sp. L1K21 TaxID=2954933 RepID=UPI00209382B9|nr:DUF4160 domain-containing protein [Rhizobium sp. L1K21]MCO6187384.1 DUF4160 domain-containing protein [Rhizobium sp. L1K21]